MVSKESQNNKVRRAYPINFGILFANSTIIVPFEIMTIRLMGIYWRNDQEDTMLMDTCLAGGAFQRGISVLLF